MYYSIQGRVLYNAKSHNETSQESLDKTLKMLEGKEVTILGYLELYSSKYQLPYLPASSSPTGSAYHSKFIEVKDVDEE